MVERIKASSEIFGFDILRERFGPHIIDAARWCEITDRHAAYSNRLFFLLPLLIVFSFASRFLIVFSSI